MVNTSRANKHTMLYFACIMLVVVLAGVGLGTRSAFAATDVGYRDQSFAANSVVNPTGEKPQSKLWFNDGTWWASMFNKTTEEFHIYRYDRASHTWSDTETLIDERNSSKADTLWDGTHLYVVSAGAQATNANHGARFTRYSYDPSTRKYTLDQGFPITLTGGGLETIVLDKDSTGKLWVTYTSNSVFNDDGNLPRQVYVSHTQSDDKSWSAPYVLPVKGASTLSSDDIASVVSFDSQIGVMWSNQIDDAVYFATHRDGDPDDVWQTSRTAIMGPKYADDHISLRSVQATDSSGRVFAAVKTSLNDVTNPNPNAPLVMLLVRDRDGNWSNHTFSRVEYNQTRPILMLDEEHKDLYMFATSSCCNGGAIMYKKTNINNISFSDGPGEPFIQGATDVNINDATSTKQNVSSATGLMVMASSGVSGYYWHNSMDLAPIDTTPPAAPEINSPSDNSYDTDGNITLSGTAEASSSVEVFDGSTSKGTTQADALGNWSKSLSGVSEGSHTFTAKATDTAGNISAASSTRTVTVDTIAPTVTITSGPSGLTNSASATFAFSSLEANSSFECSLDGATFTACTSPKGYSDLPDGSHTFSVRATDAAGNRGVAAGRTWSLDATVPTVSGVTPADGETSVTVGTSVEATFSEAINPSTLGQSTFTLVKQGTTTPITATVGYDAQARKAALQPAAALAEGATYTATIKGDTNGVKDAAGNPLQADKTWNFATVAVAAPANLTATRSGNGNKQRVDLAWVDNSGIEAKYVIERSTASNFARNLVTYEAPANAATYSDAGVQLNKQYYYRVFAANPAGTRSVASNVVSVTTSK